MVGKEMVHEDTVTAVGLALLGGVLAGIQFGIALIQSSALRAYFGPPEHWAVHVVAGVALLVLNVALAKFTIPSAKRVAAAVEEAEEVYD